MNEPRSSRTEDWKRLPERQLPAKRHVQWRFDEDEWAALLARCRPGETPGQCVRRILRFVLLPEP